MLAELDGKGERKENRLERHYLWNIKSRSKRKGWIFNLAFFQNIKKQDPRAIPAVIVR
jgi:peptide subunit release factor 1 (eRF1)